MEETNIQQESVAKVKKTFKEKLEERWGIKGWKQIILIFIVFGLTGSSSVFIGKKAMAFLRISDDMNPWIYYPIRILLVFFIYQVTLLWIGFLFGQFTFFWNFEKKMFSRISGLFKRKSTI